MINLCFVTDNGYAMPTGVTIFSIYKNRNPQNDYVLYVLCKDVNDENKNKFMQLNERGFQIKLVDCDNEDYSDLYIPGIPATPTSIYKFFIPNILSNVDKVLYMDGDIIVTRDLKELYELDIENNYIGAVKDSNGLQRKKYRKRDYSYINSGVMLMNLKKMRQDDVPSKLIDYRKNGYNKLMDQDTFNFVLRGRIKLLPFKFNTQLNIISGTVMIKENYNLNNIIDYWKIDCSINTIEDILNSSYILHYTTAKPWKYYDGYGNDLWLFYYYRSQYGNVNIIRTSYHINKLVSTKAYKIGYMLSVPIKKIKNVFKNREKKKYDKFLRLFYTKRENL